MQAGVFLRGSVNMTAPCLEYHLHQYDYEEVCRETSKNESLFLQIVELYQIYLAVHYVENRLQDKYRLFYSKGTLMLCVGHSQ